MRKQLRAFTLIQLLVAMALGGIVIAGGYVAYGMMNRNYIDFRNHASAMNQAVAFKGVLMHDFHIAKMVKRYSADEIILMQNDTVTVNYEWNEKYILRKNSIEQDTFFLSLKKVETRFNNREQVVAQGILDELIFTVFVEGQEFIFYFDRQYGSDILMQNENLQDDRH